MNRGHLNAMLCTIAECKNEGAPAGVIYAALMTHGVTLAEYQQMEAFAIEHELATKDGSHLLRPTPKLLSAFDSAKAKSQSKGQA